MNVEQWPIQRVKVYENNPRQNEAAVAAVARSIKNFGFQQPLVVDQKGVLIVGHTRLKSAQKLKLKTVPVVVADISPIKAKQYRIADNKIHEFSQWNMELLELEIKEIELQGVKMDWLDIDVNKVPVESVNPNKEWEGMPEFDQKEKGAEFSVLVNFKKKKNMEDFAELLGQTITEKTRSIWFPKAKIGRMMNKRYKDES